MMEVQFIFLSQRFPIATGKSNYNRYDSLSFGYSLNVACYLEWDIVAVTAVNSKIKMQSVKSQEIQNGTRAVSTHNK